MRKLQKVSVRFNTWHKPITNTLICWTLTISYTFNFYKIYDFFLNNYNEKGGFVKTIKMKNIILVKSVANYV